MQSWRPLGAGYDFWAHAAVGRWIWDHKRPPTTGLFLWSNDGYYWVAHSWLSELLFYFVIHAGGPLLVMIFNMLIAILSFVMVWHFWKKRGTLNFITPMLFVLAIYGASPRFQPRQEMLTAIILVILLKYLVRWREPDDATAPESANEAGDMSPRRAPLLTPAKLFTPANLGIVALFALWINLHALVFWGVVMVIITAVVDAIQYRFDQRSKVLLAVALGCMAATIVNPYTIHYWQAAEQLRPGSQTSFIDEWKPFWVRPRLPYGFVYAEIALFLAAIFAWARNPNRRWAQLFWLLLTTAMFLKSRRLLWMLSLTYLIVMAANANSFNSDACWKLWRRLTEQKELGGIPERMRFMAHAVSVTVLATTVSLYAQVFPIGSSKWFPLTTIMPETPVEIAKTIQKRDLPGRLFSDYENASYLQWALNGVDPKTGHVPTEGLRPLYIDLLSAYPDQVLIDYFDILDTKPRGLKMLRDYKINTVYLGKHHRAKEIVNYLNKSPEWENLETSEEGYLWVRRKPLR